jgi:hypothetical protein
MSTTIHSTAFACIVLTRRRGLLSSRWRTTIFRTDPVPKRLAQPFGSVVYLSHLTGDRIFAIHSDIANYINTLGDQGATLHQAFDTVTLHLAIQRFIEGRIEIYEDFSESDGL